MILLIGLVAILFRDPANAGVNTPLAAVLTALIIAAGSLNNANKTLLENPCFLWIGLVSYSLYLWHWSVLYVARMLKVDINLWTAIGLTIIMFLMAACSYYLIENPLRFSKITKTARSTILTGLLSVMAGVTALTILQRYLLSWYPAQQAYALGGRTLMGKPKDQCHVEKVDKSDISNFIRQCIAILPVKNNAIVIGNSHSLQYKPMVQGALPGWNVSSLTMWGCSYLPKDQFTAYELMEKGCNVYGEEIKTFLSQNLQKGDIVFLGYTVSPGITSEKIGRHVAELARAVRSRGAHLVIFDDVYATPLNPEDCESTLPMVLGLTRKSSACNLRVQSASNHGELLKFDRLMAGLARKDLINYVPARNWICPDQMCLYKQPNGLATFDYGSHLFQATSQSLAPLLRRELNAQNLLPKG